jgi:hypothetical protein
MEVERDESASVGKETTRSIRIDPVEILGEDTLVDHSVDVSYLYA